MIEIMAACKEKMWGFKQLFVSNIMVSLAGGGGVSRRVYIRFIDPHSSSQVSSNHVFADKQGRILQRNCVAETSARIWKNVKE